MVLIQPFWFVGALFDDKHLLHGGHGNVMAPGCSRDLPCVQPYWQGAY